MASRLARLQGVPSQQAIVDELRRVILAGDVPPGTTIPLDEVATAFGVSLIPVRESLKVLIGEGLVTHRARAGYTVALLTRTELQELYVARGVLENAVLAVAVRWPDRPITGRRRGARPARGPRSRKVITAPTTGRPGGSTSR